MKTINELQGVVLAGVACEGVRFCFEKIERGGITLVDAPNLCQVEITWLRRLLAEIAARPARVTPLEGQTGADLTLFCMVSQHLGAKHPQRAADPVGFNVMISLLMELEATYARLPIVETKAEAPA